MWARAAGHLAFLLGDDESARHWFGEAVSIARAGHKGAFSHENTQPIRDIVGREPITTKQFSQDFKGAFS